MNGEVRALNYDTGNTLWGIRSTSKLLSSSITSLEVGYMKCIQAANSGSNGDNICI